MSEVIIFGGTTEGRLLAEYCAEHQIQTTVCVVSEYGQQVLPESPYLDVLTRAMTKAMMVDLLRSKQPVKVFDATHPYASMVTNHVVSACEQVGIPYVRISRDESDQESSGKSPSLCSAESRQQEQVTWVDNVEQAVDILAAKEGAVLVTTGSKELKAYTRIRDYENRLYVRVLPDSDAIKLCNQAGFKGKHVIAMQGPFSKDMNVSLLKHTEAKFLVTKESGVAGGFMEKIEAAMACDVETIVIGRPKKPSGISVAEGIRHLKSIAPVKRKKILNLVGIGMGGNRQLTQEVVELLQASDMILGARRMLESIDSITPYVPKVTSYLSKDIIRCLEEHPECQQISIVYSGDTGFYSGARALQEELTLGSFSKEYEVNTFPGISSVSYFCAKLGISWDDAYLTSAHGRTLDICQALKNHEKVFLLLGGDDSVQNLSSQLIEGGYPNIKMFIGERLSYPEERIVQGTPKDLIHQTFHTLSVALLKKEEEL